MDLTITRAELQRALHLTQNIVARRTTMPILVNVLLSASDNQLRVSATDLEITAVVTANATVRSPGSITLNARVLADIVRELPDADVVMKLSEGDRMSITSQSSKLRMIGVSAEEYPSLPGMGFDARMRVPATELLEMINKTLYAVSYDEARINLNGVCFDVLSEGKGKKAEKSLRLVATDGHRLALITRTVGDIPFEGNVIVPRKGLAEIRKVLEEEDERDVGIDIIESFLLLETERARVSIRLVNSDFPKYDQVLPRDEGSIATVQSGMLAQALRRVALMVTDRAKCVKLDFAPGKLRISSSSPELGEASEDLDVTYSGEPISIGFNALYLLDIAASFGEERLISIELHGEIGPGKFFSESDAGYIAIVMPMRLDAAPSRQAA